MAAASSPATKPSSWTPSTIGSTWLEAKSGVEGLDDVRLGEPRLRAPRRSRAVSIVGPVRTEGHPVRDVDDGLAGDGVADLGGDGLGAGERDGEDDDVGRGRGVAFDSAARAPAAAATAAASPDRATAMTTACPARPNEVARARPTLPAPMMAMFMVGTSWSLDQLVRVKQTLLQAQRYDVDFADVNTMLCEGKHDDRGTRRAPQTGRRRAGQALAPRARPDAGRRRRAERPQRRLPVADRERQGVAVARLPGRASATPWTSRSPGSSSTRCRHRSVVRASERPVTGDRARRGSSGSTANASRDLSIVEAVARPGARTGAHAHAGDEHHLVLRGRFRMTQGDHVVEVGTGRLRPLGRDDPARRRGHRRRGGGDADRQPPGRRAEPGSQPRTRRSATPRKRYPVAESQPSPRAVPFAAV